MHAIIVCVNNVQACLTDGQIQKYGRETQTSRRAEAHTDLHLDGQKQAPVDMTKHMIVQERCHSKTHVVLPSSNSQSCLLCKYSQFPFFSLFPLFVYTPDNGLVHRIANRMFTVDEDDDDDSHEDEDDDDNSEDDVEEENLAERHPLRKAKSNFGRGCTQSIPKLASLLLRRGKNKIKRFSFRKPKIKFNRVTPRSALCVCVCICVCVCVCV